MSSTTVYRRQSMAQLYEKLRALDDEDDMAWLAQFSPEDKYDEPYAPVVASPASLSTISSGSTSTSTSSPSTQRSQVDQHSDSESSDDGLCSDSDSDVDPEPLSLDLHYPDFEPAAYTSLIFQPHDFATVTESEEDLPYLPAIQDNLALQLDSSPERAKIMGQPVSVSSSPVSQVVSPVVTAHAPAPFTAMRRTTRSTRTFSKMGDPLSDEGDDAHAESDGDATEDEYLPSPTLNPGKRRRYPRSATAAPSSSAPSRKRKVENVAPPAKRPRHSPLPRNAQAALGVVPGSAAKNPWACPYCKWVQRNHRTPDLKRHIRTHTRLQRPAQWVCCGVPLKDAENYVLPEDAKSLVWEGKTMVGGCGKEFSRRDALKRHLNNDHITCIGNFSAFANIYEDDD
ncbi:hypothetical protein BDN67DRAFT_1001828 [Paxillus ammoniavirescens]|nr:hypothetical protein BDN67DRAFT_1001828 [Paxillus ammoniavirescens]